MHSCMSVHFLPLWKVKILFIMWIEQISQSVLAENNPRPHLFAEIASNSYLIITVWFVVTERGSTADGRLIIVIYVFCLLRLFSEHSYKWFIQRRFTERVHYIYPFTHRWRRKPCKTPTKDCFSTPERLPPRTVLHIIYAEYSRTKPCWLTPWL